MNAVRRTVLPVVHDWVRRHRWITAYAAGVVIVWAVVMGVR